MYERNPLQLFKTFVFNACEIGCSWTRAICEVDLYPFRAIACVQCRAYVCVRCRAFVCVRCRAFSCERCRAFSLRDYLVAMLRHSRNRRVSSSPHLWFRAFVLDRREMPIQGLPRPKT